MVEINPLAADKFGNIIVLDSKARKIIILLSLFCFLILFFSISILLGVDECC